MSNKTFRSDEEKTAWGGIAKKLVDIHWSHLEQRGVPRAMAEAYIRRWSKAGWIEQTRKDGHRKVFGHAGARGAACAGGHGQDARRRDVDCDEPPCDVFAAGFTCAGQHRGPPDVTLTAARRYCRHLLLPGICGCASKGGAGTPRSDLSVDTQNGGTGPDPPPDQRRSGPPNKGEFIANLKEGGQA